MVTFSDTSWYVMMLKNYLSEGVSVCVCVCLCVSTLTAEPFDLSPWFLVWELTLTLASLGLYVKVVGQRSPHKISLHSNSALLRDLWSHLSDMSNDVMKCDVTLWCHDITLCRPLTSHNEFWGERTSKCPTREVRERSSVFVLF